MDMERNFSGLGAKHYAASLDEVANIEHLIEEVHPFLTQVIRAEEQLHLARTVFDMSKRNLAHGARGANAARQHDLDLSAGLLSGFKGRNRLVASMCPFSAGWKSFHAFRAQLFDLLQPDFFK